MTHDPLCRLAKTDAPAGYVGVMIECDCYKVRYVRADEREKAAQRVAKHDLKPCEDYERSCACWRCERHEHMQHVIAAARGEAS
jgi:hypothetical protein